MSDKPVIGGTRLPPPAYMAWAEQCVKLIDRYRDVPDAKIVEHWDRGRMRLDHILLPSGEEIPFPPQPEE